LGHWCEDLVIQVAAAEDLRVLNGCKEEDEDEEKGRIMKERKGKRRKFFNSSVASQRLGSCRERAMNELPLLT
jgi:hypothetical protein